MQTNTDTPITATTRTDSSWERRRQLALATEDIITIEAWRDPVVEGHPQSTPTNSDHTLFWWTPILGPTSTLMAHRFAALTANGDTHSFTTRELARTFGLGDSTSRLRATIARLERFGVARTTHNTIAVRLALAPLTVRQLRALPGYMAVAYREQP